MAHSQYNTYLQMDEKCPEKCPGQSLGSLGGSAGLAARLYRNNLKIVNLKKGVGINHHNKSTEKIKIMQLSAMANLPNC